MKRAGLILTLMCLVLLTGCSLSVNQNFAKKNAKSWDLHSKAARAHYMSMKNTTAMLSCAKSWFSFRAAWMAARRC